MAVTVKQCLAKKNIIVLLRRLWLFTACCRQQKLKDGNRSLLSVFNLTVVATRHHGGN
jgi:hypothetical protein